VADTVGGPPDRLLTDEMFSPTLAQRVAVLGVDCRPAVEDPSLPVLGAEWVVHTALEDRRVVVTGNTVDFESIRRRREADGRLMPKLIYVTDEHFPRNRRFMMVLAEALVRAAREHRASADGGVHWL
jgi:Domain of unknown function (DUF5615)